VLVNNIINNYLYLLNNNNYQLFYFLGFFLFFAVFAGFIF